MPDPFHWLEDSTVSITTANSSANIALKKMPTGVVQLRVVNDFTSTQFIRKGGNSSVVAAATDFPIKAGATEVFTFFNDPKSPITHLAMISPTGSGTLYASTGAGL